MLLFQITIVFFVILHIGDGDDYVSGPYNVTIPAGQTIVSFDISIVDDNIYEQRKQFDVNIEQISTLSGVHIGSSYTATVVITDDSDCK